MSGQAAVAEFPFEFREGFVWCRVTVPQSAEPLDFLLDTGASVSVINLHTADRLGLRRGERVGVRGVHSNVVGYWPQRLPAKAGEVLLPEDYLAVNLDKLAKACNRPVDGLLGTDFFRGRIVQVDFAAQKIRILQSYEPSSSAEVLPLELRRCGMRVPLRVNGGHAQWVRLDTGCASALHWVTSKVQSEPCTAQMAVALTELRVSTTQTKVVIGATEFVGVPTGLHKKELFAGEAGLLGNGLLSRFTAVTIDAQSGRLVLESAGKER